MSIHDLDSRRPRCCYCGSKDPHPDYTCPRIKSVTIFPECTEITLHDEWEEWEYEVTYLPVDDDESVDCQANT